MLQSVGVRPRIRSGAGYAREGFSEAPLSRSNAKGCQDKNRLGSCIALFLLFLSGMAAAIGLTPLDPAKSSVTVTFTQLGVAVDAPFKQFTGEIAFNPSAPAEARAKLEIRTASLDLGDEEYNAEVRKKEWFDSKTYPTAVFESDGVQVVNNSSFRAKGALTLKGKTNPLSIDFIAKRATDGMIYEGGFPISRAAYGIGDASWGDVLNDEVEIRFRVVVQAVQ
jgi:polyisoprenoid-binding protein YceI